MIVQKFEWAIISLLLAAILLVFGFIAYTRDDLAKARSAIQKESFEKVVQPTSPSPSSDGH